MDKKTMESMKTYNKKAVNYENTMDGRVTRQMKIDLVEAIKPRDGQRILDVACGNGILLEMMSKKASLELFGMDISDVMAAEAKKRLPGANIQTGDSRSLPFEDSCFDLVTVSAAFHHFTHPDDFLKETIRVLKKGGKLYMGEFVMGPVSRFVMNLILPIMKSGDVRLYRLDELEEFFKQAGFIHIGISRDGSRCILSGVKP